MFTGWSDGGAPSHTITPGSTVNVFTANFRTQYSLNLPTFSATVATITVNPALTDLFYDAGTKLQVTATPGPGWKFSQWTDDLNG